MKVLPFTHLEYSRDVLSLSSDYITLCHRSNMEQLSAMQCTKMIVAWESDYFG